MNKLKFYSTNRNAPEVAFSEAMLRGQAPDRGLYLPAWIPKLSPRETGRFSGMEYHEIASEIIGKFTEGEIARTDLSKMTRDAYNFEVPLENIYDNNWIMRLDRGPTASFKDFAGRMMGRMMKYFNDRRKGRLLILTATSGDTGSAVANAFHNLENIEVVVLFPENEVSARQRKQMTTLGGNTRIISVKGKFDDCQALVKKAFNDPGLQEMNLSSANSINIGRLIPQIVYYFYAWSRLRAANGDDTIIFSIPSGNFGDMMGGTIAGRMGLPVEKFIIAVNGNDEFPRFLHSGVYKKIDPSVNCLSSAMNVGHPSNLARLVDMYGGNMDEKGNISRMPDMDAMQNDIFALSVSDSETKATIKEIWDNYGVILEPHGAVGWKGISEYLGMTDPVAERLSVTLETAHPAKFPEEIEKLTGVNPELPPALDGLEDKKEYCSFMDNNYMEFKEMLKSNY